MDSHTAAIVLSGIRGLDLECVGSVASGAFEQLLDRLGIQVGSERFDAVVDLCSVLPDGTMDYSNLVEYARQHPLVIGAPESKPTRENVQMVATPNQQSSTGKFARPSSRPPIPHNQHMSFLERQADAQRHAREQFNQEKRSEGVHTSNVRVQSKDMYAPQKSESDRPEQQSLRENGLSAFEKQQALTQKQALERFQTQQLVEEESKSTPSAFMRPAPVLTPLPVQTKDRVLESVPQLRNIFHRYDTGRITIKKVESEIRDLGLEITSSFVSLMRSAPLDMTFGQLFQSLLQTARDEAHMVPSQIPTSPAGRESINSPWSSKKIESRANTPISNSTRRLEPEKANASSIVLGQTPQTQWSSKSLKDQVYQNIRYLDQNRITSTDFVRQLSLLNVPITVDVHRMLARSRADGTVNFQQFALAFDPILREIEQKELSRNATPINAQAPPPAPLMHQTRAAFHKPYLAQTNHGDLIAWSNAPSRLEQEESEMHEKGRRHLKYNAIAEQDHINLTWDVDARQRQPSSTQQATELSKAQQLPVQNAHACSTRDLLVWDTQR